MKKFCSNCQEWKESWADHPNYQSPRTYRRHERCWSCDEWTLSERTIFVPRSSVVDRGMIQQGLDAVRTGQTNKFTCSGEKYTSSNGVTVRERLIYNGGNSYTRIIEKGEGQVVETKELKTFEEVFFLEFIEAVIENSALVICSIQ